MALDKAISLGKNIGSPIMARKYLIILVEIMVHVLTASRIASINFLI